MSDYLNLPGGSKKEIMLLHPDDFRREDIKVIQEVDIALLSEEHEGHQYRIRKLGPGWKSDKDTRWLCLEGMPITNCIIEDNQEPLDIIEFLEWAWTPEVVEELDTDLLNKLTTDFAVTVKIQPVEVPKTMNITALKAFDYLQDHLRNVFRLIPTHEEEKDWKDDLMEKGIILALGAFMMYFFVNAGII